MARRPAPIRISEAAADRRRANPNSPTREGIDWYSTPRDARKRKGIEIMLSPEARTALDAMAEPGRRSEFVERLILAAYAASRSSGPGLSTGKF